MLQQWESADKSIRKNVLKSGIFTRKPTECSTCNVFVENISVSGSSEHILKEEYHTNILDGESEKVLVIGEASAEIDRKVERAIQVMNTFEKSLVTITMPSEVKSKAVLVMFEITLTKCERYKPIWEWSPEEKYQVALKYKEIGVELFKSSRCVDAFHKFSRACKILITLEPISELEDKLLQSNIENLRLTLYNNMANCQLNQKNFEHTVALCTKILNVDKENVKAFYRRGIAYGSMKDDEKAVADLKVALTLEPNNHTVKEQFHIYNTRLQNATQKCNDMVRKMFKF